MSEARDQAGAAAERIRHEFERTLQELDRRTRDARDVGLQVHRHALGAAVGGTVLLAAVGAAVAFGRTRRRSRELRLRQRRWTVLKYAWRHPERWVGASPLAWRDVGAKVAAAALAELTRGLIRRTVRVRTTR